MLSLRPAPSLHGSLSEPVSPQARAAGTMGAGRPLGFRPGAGILRDFPSVRVQDPRPARPGSAQDDFHEGPGVRNAEPNGGAEKEGSG